MKLEGIYPAIVTPFDANDRVDLEAFGRLLDFVITGGVKGIAVLGSTGEFYACSQAERSEILAFAKQAVGGRAQLIAGTNAASTRDVVANSREALALGYDAVLLAPPYYSLPSQPELTKHFRAVLDDVDIPVVLYNYPARAGVEIGYEVLDAIVEHPNLIGIKESSGDINRLHGLLSRYGHLGEGFTVCCGGDDQAFEYFSWGVRAWIGGGASFVPREHVEVLAAAQAGDLALARARMQQLMPLLQSLESGKYTQKVKLGCALAGIPVGETRAPLFPLDPAERAEFEAVYARTVA